MFQKIVTPAPLFEEAKNKALEWGKIAVLASGLLVCPIHLRELQKRFNCQDETFTIFDMFCPVSGCPSAFSFSEKN